VVRGIHGIELPAGRVRRVMRFVATRTATLSRHNPLKGPCIPLSLCLPRRRTLPEIDERPPPNGLENHVWADALEDGGGRR